MARTFWIYGGELGGYSIRKCRLISLKPNSGGDELLAQIDPPIPAEVYGTGSDVRDVVLSFQFNAEPLLNPNCQLTGPIPGVGAVMYLLPEDAARAKRDGVLDKVCIWASKAAAESFSLGNDTGAL